MPKRRSDAAFRWFLDQYPKIRISRFRATGVVDPARNYAVNPVGERQKLIGTRTSASQRRWLVLFHLSEMRPPRRHALSHR